MPRAAAEVKVESLVPGPDRDTVPVVARVANPSFKTGLGAPANLNEEGFSPGRAPSSAPNPYEQPELDLEENLPIPQAHSSEAHSSEEWA